MSDGRRSGVAQMGWALAGLMAMVASVAAERLPDPTRPAAYEQRSAPAVDTDKPVWRLESLVMGPERRRAMISGEWVEEGGRLGSARVVRIEAEGVVLREGDDTQVVRWPEVPVVRRQLTGYGHD